MLHHVLQTEILTDWTLCNTRVYGRPQDATRAPPFPPQIGEAGALLAVLSLLQRGGPTGCAHKRVGIPWTGLLYNKLVADIAAHDEGHHLLVPRRGGGIISPDDGVAPPSTDCFWP